MSSIEKPANNQYFQRAQNDSEIEKQEMEVDANVPVVPPVTVPDGGFTAWSTVFGGWLILFSGNGYIYAFGVFQDYYTRVYMTNRTPSEISWIGSFQFAFPFFMGIVSGKLFDAGYFHFLEGSGGLIFVFSLFMLSLAKPDHYYQVFLSQGLGMGLGIGLMFVPTFAVLTHHFRSRYALATGIVLSGNSVGGIVFPIMLNKLLAKHTFGDSVRATGYIVLGCMIIGIGLMRTRLPPKSKSSSGSDAPNLKGFLLDPPYMIMVLSGLLASFGIYFPIIYGQLYAVKNTTNANLAFYALTIINAGGAFGRVVGSRLADAYGVFNVMIPVLLMTGVMTWLVLVITGTASLVVVTLLYGIFSGSYLSQVMASFGSLSKSPKEVGARTGLALAFISFGTLVSGPIQGAVLTSDFKWIRPVVFSTSFVFVATLTTILNRHLLTKERRTQRV